MRDKKIKEKKTKKAARIVKPVLICCGVMLLILIGVLAAFVWKQIQQAPDISEIDATPDGYLSTILDKDENVEKIFDDYFPDTLILTSDGIHDFVDIDFMENTLSSISSDSDATQAIIEEARKNGSTDDTTIIILRR